MTALQMSVERAAPQAARDAARKRRAALVRDALGIAVLILLLIVGLALHVLVYVRLP